MTVLIWVLAIAAVVAGFVAYAIRWRRESDVRVVRCPETGEKQAVVVDPGHAISHALRGDDARRLKSCTRWPERQDCDQPCLQEIASAPDGCFVRSQLDSFYAGAECALCGKPFGDHVDWAVHEPGLLDEHGHITVWEQHPARKMDEVLAHSRPVCWDCTQMQRVAESQPERITVREHKKYARSN